MGLGDKASYESFLCREPALMPPIATNLSRLGVS